MAQKMQQHSTGHNGLCTFVVPGVLEKVLSEDPHKNSSQEARQQQHRHTRVYDAEPVDLQPVRIFHALDAVSTLAGSLGFKPQEQTC